MRIIELIEFSGEAASRRRLYAATLLLSLLCLVMLTSVQFHNNQISIWFDFQYFHLVGRLTWSGKAGEAYYPARFVEILRPLGDDGFAPWMYPPPYDLFLAPLSALPLSISFLLFILLGLCAYIFTLRLIAEEYFVSVLLLCFPGMILNTRIGQNGFLTGTLIGWSAVLLLRNRPVAGIPLGLTIIKPHLALAAAFYMIFDRRWKSVALAFAASASLVLFATVVLGSGIWLDYGHGLEQAAMVLNDTEMLACMLSLYSSLVTAGIAPQVAYVAQGCFSILLIFSIFAAVRIFPRKQALGISLACSLIINPYAMAYDIPVLGVSLGLLFPDIASLATINEKFVFYSVIFFASASDLIRVAILGRNSGSPYLFLFAATGLCLPIMYLLLWRIFLRGSRLQFARPFSIRRPDLKPRVFTRSARCAS